MWFCCVLACPCIYRRINSANKEKKKKARLRKGWWNRWNWIRKLKSFKAEKERQEAFAFLFFFSSFSSQFFFVAKFYSLSVKQFYLFFFFWKDYRYFLRIFNKISIVYRTSKTTKPNCRDSSIQFENVGGRSIKKVEKIDVEKMSHR